MYTVLTESKLMPRKGQISVFTEMKAWCEDGELIDKNIIKKERNKVIHIFRGVNLLLVSTVYSTQNLDQEYLV